MRTLCGVGPLLLSALLAACGDGSSSAICPTCRPMVGGQTGDFGSVLPDNCHPTVRELTPALRQQFGLDELSATLARPFASPLEWEKPTADLGSVMALGRTILDASVSLGELTYTECADQTPHQVTASASASWATRDGKLTAETRGQLVFDAADQSWMIDGESDLSEAKGTLDVQIDTKRIVVGTLRSQISPYSMGGFEGFLSVSLEYFDNEAMYLAHRQSAGSDTPGPASATETPIEGWFPPPPPVLPMPPCTPGEKSVPNSASDPCPQTTPQCPHDKYVAVSTCGSDGMWSRMCECLPAM